ncbi:hypothetical protein SCALM49S_01021 [Streptomyces californicus]
MANIKSQIKRNKTNEKARLRNKAVKSSLKTAIRKAREAVVAGDVEKATTAVRDASRQLDKAVSKGVIHKNAAANKKSALAFQGCLPAGLSFFPELTDVIRRNGAAGLLSRPCPAPAPHAEPAFATGVQRTRA